MSINLSSTTVFIPDIPTINVVENTADEEIVYHWNANGFVVYLIKEKDSIKYKTIDRDQKEIYTNCIEIPESKSLERMLSHLKQCVVMVDQNGVTRFLTAYKTWAGAYAGTEISLVRESKDLAWNVFNKITNESSFHSFQKATIPSMQCHPETISRIEKIKTEAFNNRQLLHSLISDFTVRAIDPEEFKEQLDAEKNNVKTETSIDKFNQESFIVQDKKIMYSLAAGATYLARNAVVVTASSVSRFLGNGILGTVVGAYTGAFTAAVLGGVGGGIALSGAQAVASYFFPYSLPDSLHKKQEALKERACLVSIEKPLFIKVEPISALSEIDPRLRVSKFAWAVTVVNGIEGPSKNHTAILIEGLANEYFQGSVADGEYFLHKSEFNPPISSHLYSLRKLKMYISQGLRRTEIWMKPSKQVIAMLQEIARQQQLHEEKLEREEDIKWAVTGSDSWFSGGLDNCFTWTRKSVALLDIKLGKNFHSHMFAWPRSFTNTFEEQENSLFVDIKI